MGVSINPPNPCLYVPCTLDNQSINPETYLLSDNKQQEIDLLIKKAIDHIGQLPDLEPKETPMDNSDHLSNKRGLRKRPVNPIDVTRESLVGKSEQFPKAETPGSDNLRNYDILIRYKALYGEKNRDKWLDKLVDCIPLASKESAGASHAESYCK